MDTQADRAITTNTNVQYEQALLGAYLAGTARVSDLPPVPEHFWGSRNAALASALLAADAAGVPGEPVALAGWLAAEGQLAGAGGTVGLAEMVAVAAVGLDNARWYAGQLAELAARREIVVEAARIQQTAQGAGVSSAQLAARMSDAARRIGGTGSAEVLDIGDFTATGLAEIDLRTDAPAGWTTGYPDLDRLFPGGWGPGNVVSIAAPTSGGKTTLGLNILDHLVRQKARSVLFTIEMTTQEVFDKMLSAATGIPYSSILTGALTDDEWARAARWSATLADAPLSVRQGAVGMPEIRSTCAEVARRRGGLDVVVVDYAQLVRTSTRGNITREQALAEAFRQIKEVAMGDATGSPVLVIVMVQCSRAASLRSEHIPVLSDLRETGEIENTSSVVLMLHTETMYDAKSVRLGETDVWVRKNRFGPRDVKVTMACQWHRSRLVSLEPAADG